MKYYQDITLISDSKLSIALLWHKVFQQTHFALVNCKIDENSSGVAVSFPEYGKQDFHLGNKLRLFSKTKSQLEALNISHFLERLSDYVHIKSISDVPNKTKAISFIRKHVKCENRIEQDMLKKINLLETRDSEWFKSINKTLEQCIAELSSSKPNAESLLPFIWLESQQTKKRIGLNAAKFPLFIEKIEAETHNSGFFSCYGLAVKSKNGTIPTVPDF